MSFLFNTIHQFLSSEIFLLLVNFISFSLKSVILAIVLNKKSKTFTINRPYFYLVLVLAGAIVEDLSWVLLLAKKIFLADSIFLTPFLHKIFLFILRISWAFYIIQYQGLSLFIESMIKKTTHSVALYQRVFLTISTFFLISFVAIAILSFNSTTPLEFQHSVQEAATLYIMFFLMPITAFYVLYMLKKSDTPRILKKQAKLLIQFLILPRIVAEFIQTYPFNFFYGHITSNYPMVGLSTALFTFIIYYCARKIMGLRFMNFENHVQAPQQYGFVDHIRQVLDQLSHVASLREVGSTVQDFFKKSLGVPDSRAYLHIRSSSVMQSDNKQNKNTVPLSKSETITENFFAINAQEIYGYLTKTKIIIHDEIDFSNFYEEDDFRSSMIAFMDSLNADVFLPIFKDQRIIAYVIVERFARQQEFYTNLERDEMIIFASYLGNVINLLQSRNLETVLAQEKELREELYKKQQENTQYKESIRSFLKNSHQKDIGIIYYKQRRFFFANQAAKEMVPININMLEGHPLTKAIKRVAQLVEMYKTPQTTLTYDVNSNRLIISGVPHLDHNSVILTICHPDITDIISKQINTLKDPSKWDYLLYLETTQPGQLISRLIPASGEKMLNFKINLLELALTTKALLLELPDEDAKPVVELIHTISMRQKIKTLKLNSPTYGFDTAIMLFGINSVFGKKNNELPLLEQLDESGTLFIQNIEFLDMETQDYLADFIKYGVYRIFKSEQRVTSGARIICSTTNHLPTLVQEGKFSAALFNELKAASLVMPPLLSIDEQEFNELTEGFSEQTLKTDDFKNILELTSREKRKLTDKRPNSLQQLKERIAQILINKSKETNLYHEIEITPIIEETDPELVQAARMGKHALRDKRLMNLLWHKFKNQNQIAHFLGVNRSSVNRRCKEYNLF